MDTPPTWTDTSQAKGIEFDDCKAAKKLSHSSMDTYADIGKHPAGSAGAASGNSRDAAAAAAALDEAFLNSIQSPVPAIKETAEVIVKLLIMFVLLDFAAGLVKGESPLQLLLVTALHLKLVIRALLAPLSMMCSGFLLAVVQYNLSVRQQRSSAAQHGGSAGGATGKNKFD